MERGGGAAPRAVELRAVSLVAHRDCALKSLAEVGVQSSERCELLRQFI